MTIHSSDMEHDGPMEDCASCNRECLCCDYKTCPHTCTEDDPCVACVGRGDCGDGMQR